MMFISKFNALIRNKIIWGAFAFIIAMAFVVWGTKTGSSTSDSQNSVGMLDGKDVPPEEFRHAYFNSYLSMSLMFGRPLQVSATVDQALKKMAWKRLIALRKAKDLGVPVTGDEVIAAIKEQPYFQVDGRFSQERYQAFVNTFLSNLRISEPQFEEHIREEILLSKLRYLLAQAVWVSPFYAGHLFHQLYDTFTVSYAALLEEELGHMVTTSEEQARIFFDENSEQFMIPEKMSVKYVTFPVKDFVDEESVDEDLMQSYYDDHITEFTTIGTDGWETIQPFEEVEDTIRETIVWEKATIQAGDKAADFEVMLAPERDGSAPSFEQAASVIGLTVSTSAFFSIREPLKDVDAGPEFTKAAFDLRQTPDEYFSYPVQGKKAFYILAYHQRTDSHIPDFDEVKEDVMAAATEKAVSDKLKELSTDIHESVAAALKKGASFSKAVAPFSLEVFTPEPFTVTSELDEYSDSEQFYMLIKHAISHNAMELTDIIPIKNGFLIAYVESRVPADRATYEAIKNDFSRYIKKQREDTLFSEWQEYLLASAHFKDLLAEKESIEEEPDSESEERDTD